MSTKYLSIAQVAQTLGINEATVRRAIAAGNLKALRAGKQYRIAPEAVDAWIGA